MNLDDITLCLTIGKRPKELEESLSSLLSFLPFRHIIAINDFGDELTNDVFTKLCPHGTLINCVNDGAVGWSAVECGHSSVIA